MENKIKETKKEIIELSIKCPICKKEIKGSTKNQILYNLKIHTEAKHEGNKMRGETDG